jgi:nitroreductase
METWDAIRATITIMLVAADMGIGSGHSAVGDQDLARKLLGFPEDHFCAFLIALGYPSDGRLAPLEKLNRRPFDEVVHRGRW